MPILASFLPLLFFPTLCNFLCSLLVIVCTVGGSGIEASWAGGLDGRVVIDRFLPLLDVRINLYMES